MKAISEHKCFDGVQGYYSHDSRETGLPMRFSVYQPPRAREHKVPVLFYLAGLTCTEETFMIKAGAQRLAAEHGIALVACDTSPRDAGVPGEGDDWDFGLGAGFYVDATQSPWSKHYRMYSYVARELPGLIADAFPVDSGRQGIFGHSMGGHGAITLALRNPGQFRSLSAFAPICAPSRCPWGEKAFGGYLGDDRAAWAQHDATELISRQAYDGLILIDQGMSDVFLEEQLYPEAFEAASKKVNQKLTLRRHEGYDHGYFFISTFIEDHLRHHAAQLNA
ncbi:MAG TPA: S-formylglutathione hydrolase [Burkholderiales bacterium]|nr:S-formylglutathione hydrolase [Burkholderiales bacterium]